MDNSIKSYIDQNAQMMERYITEEKTVLPDPPNQNMKFNELANLIQLSGIDDKFSRGKFHLYVEKGLIDKGEKSKINQATYTAGQYYQYLFVVDLGKSFSLEMIRSIMDWMRLYSTQNKQFSVSELCKVYLMLRSTINIDIQKFFEDMANSIVEQIKQETPLSEEDTMVAEKVMQLIMGLLSARFSTEMMSKMVGSETNSKHEI